MNKQNTPIQPIQIIGTQRSGSNLLRVMLNELNEVAAPHPPHILKTFQPLVPEYGDLTQRENFRLLVDDVCRFVECNPVEWDGVSLDRQSVLSGCRQPTLLEIFRVVYETLANSHGARFWCCKSMANGHFFHAIENAGIRPFYIHLVRDGRDVASSFRKVAVGDKHIFHLAKKWKEDQSASFKVIETVGAKRGIVVHYEELISTPEVVMKKICGLLGVPYTDRVLGYYQSEESRHTASAGYMWHNLSQPILAGNCGKYAQTMDPEELALFEYIAGGELERYGYERVADKRDFQLSPKVLSEFEAENERLKDAIRSSHHLRIDISKRKKQEELIKSIKNRKHILKLIQA
ncbi:MAG: sulfotransferase [Cyclobacteriaceae bacterium]